jgi:lysophospholipase L1-like esterase
MRLGLGLHSGRGNSRPAGGGGLRTADNNYVGMIGASTINNGGDLLGNWRICNSGVTKVGSFHGWGVALSEGGLFWGGAAATGGFTIQQAIDTHLPTMLAATPLRGFIGISAGTNDIDAIGSGGVLQPAALAFRVDYIEDNFVIPVLAAGSLPFLCAPQPSESANGIVAMPALGQALDALAASYGIPFVDIFGALGDYGTGLYDDDAYDADGLHLTNKGARVAGQEFADALAPYRNQSHSATLVTTGDDTTGWAWKGGRFAADADTDGQPDGGGTGILTDVWGAASNATLTTSADPGVVDGKWFNVNKTAAGGSSSTSTTSTTGVGPIPVNAGDKYELAWKMKTNFIGENVGASLRLASTTDNNARLCYFISPGQLDIPIPALSFQMLATVPAAVTLVRFMFGEEVYDAGNTDIGMASIAQLSLRLVDGSMAGSGTGAWYGLALDAMRKGNLELDAGTFKVALASSSYTPNVDTDQYRSALGTEVTGTNWATGGVATTVTLDQDTTNNRLRVFCTDISVATVTLTDAKHAVLYKSLGGAASADPLIGYVTFDTALAPTAGTLAIDFDGTNGFLREAY